jgi:hypothetical protein
MSVGRVLASRSLNETVAAEIAALPADMQARFLRLSERIGQAGRKA